MHVLVLPVFNSIIYDTVCDVPACRYVALWENLGFLESYWSAAMYSI